MTAPPGTGRESRRTSEAVTQIAPGIVVGGGVGDFDGFGDLDGEGLGDFAGVVLLDGLGVRDGLELPVVGDGLDVGLGGGAELCVGVLCVGLGLGEPDGLPGPIVPAGFRLCVGLAPIRPAESANTLAWTVAAAPEPHRPPSGAAGSASTGATAGPDSRNRPAPVATATCPTRTTLTGTAALR